MRLFLFLFLFLISTQSLSQNFLLIPNNDSTIPISELYFNTLIPNDSIIGDTSFLVNIKFNSNFLEYEIYKFFLKNLKIDTILFSNYVLDDSLKPKLCKEKLIINNPPIFIDDLTSEGYSFSLYNNLKCLPTMILYCKLNNKIYTLIYPDEKCLLSLRSSEFSSLFTQLFSILDTNSLK